jgi:hypothetical protein
MLSSPTFPVRRELYIFKPVTDTLLQLTTLFLFELQSQLTAYTSLARSNCLKVMRRPSSTLEPLLVGTQSSCIAYTRKRLRRPMGARPSRRYLHGTILLSGLILEEAASLIRINIPPHFSVSPLCILLPMKAIYTTSYTSL